jgi:hypothetical protein
MIILDTHIWVWWVHGDERLTESQAELIYDRTEWSRIPSRHLPFSNLENRISSATGIFSCDGSDAVLIDCGAIRLLGGQTAI